MSKSIRLALCHIALLVLLSLFWGIKTSAQHSAKTTGNKSSVPIYFLGSFGKTFNAFAKENNFGEAKFITRSFLYDVHSNTLMPDKLKKRIEQLFPHPSDKGIGIIDWEGPAFLTLRAGKVEDSAYQAALQGFTDAIKLAKKVRPHVTWGFYGIPFNTYWHRNELWRENFKKIIPLLQYCDILCPSLYEPYKAGDFFKGDDSAFVADNMHETLKLGYQLNKPVFPFVWYRYHPTNKKIGLDLIPPEEFNRHIQQILSATYHGQQAGGIIVYEMSYNPSNPESSKVADLKPYERMKEKGANDAQLYTAITRYRDSIAMAYGKRILNIIH